MNKEWERVPTPTKYENVFSTRSCPTTPLGIR